MNVMAHDRCHKNAIDAGSLFHFHIIISVFHLTEFKPRFPLFCLSSILFSIYFYATFLTRIIAAKKPLLTVLHVVTVHTKGGARFLIFF